MNESVGGVVMGLLALAGLTYLGMKVRQNQQKMRRIVGVVDKRHVHEISQLFQMADAGELALYQPGVAT
jgi:hypothetical protein